jgi:nucleotide-binding universal stress UspA family protein
MSTQPSLQRFMVATDLSLHADFAVKRALQLATAHEAEVDLVHIIEEGLPLEAQNELMATSEKNVQEQLSKFQVPDNIKVTIDIVAGRTELDIVEHAARSGADCILLGFLDRVLEENRVIEGTLAETIIRSSKIPVLLVKNDPDGPYRTAVVGVDLTPLSAPAIRAATLIAPEVALHFVHSYGDEGEASDEKLEAAKTEELKAFIAGVQHLLPETAVGKSLPVTGISIAAKQGRPLDVLKKELKATQANLMVLGTHGRTGWARTIMGSVTTDVIDECLCDVLVVCPE